jgi:hypothetical protein
VPLFRMLSREQLELIQENGAGRDRHPKHILQLIETRFRYNREPISSASISDFRQILASGVAYCYGGICIKQHLWHWLAQNRAWPNDDCLFSVQVDVMVLQQPHDSYWPCRAICELAHCHASESMTRNTIDIFSIEIRSKHLLLHLMFCALLCRYRKRSRDKRTVSSGMTGSEKVLPTGLAHSETLTIVQNNRPFIATFPQNLLNPVHIDNDGTVNSHKLLRV